MNATNAVVENKMEPVNKAEEQRPLVVTGQGLYDMFMVASDTDKTRMASIRDLAVKADAAQIQGATDKLVEIAREKDAAEWVKNGGKLNDKGMPVGEDGKKVRGTKEQVAMNVRVVVRNAWGALHFAREQSEALGYTDATSYESMRVLSKKALERKGIIWSGEGVKTEADKANARLLREQKAETDALLDTYRSIPRQINETAEEWQARVMEAAKESVHLAREEAEHKIVVSVVDGLFQKHGEARAAAIAGEIASRLGIVIDGTGEKAPDAEPDEDEVAARMAAVPEEQAAH